MAMALDVARGVAINAQGKCRGVFGRCVGGGDSGGGSGSAIGVEEREIFGRSNRGAGCDLAADAAAGCRVAGMRAGLRTRAEGGNAQGHGGGD